VTTRSEEDGAAPRTAVFLDRDGTVIVDRHYLGDPAGVELLPGAADAISRLNRAGIKVILVTNQSGIGRGYFSESDFRAVQRRLSKLLADADAHLDGVYHCPHSPDETPACECRKPKPGLFLMGAAEHRVDLCRSFLVGDRDRDVSPARALGATGILVHPDGPRPGSEGQPTSDVAATVPSLAAAVELILRTVERIDARS
jgi:D-glycero-D-manno-heptose 1,7-bisphosphate phosphatase